MICTYEPLDIEYERDSKKKGIISYQGRYRYLSNFFVLDTPFELDGEMFDSSERAYMWYKSNDPKYKKKIMEAKNPRCCKALGYTAKLIPGWDSKRIEIMYKVVTRKLDLPHLHELFMQTGNKYLEETNTWGDTFWGRCKGKGENHLGRIHMCVRSENKRIRRWT